MTMNEAVVVEEIRRRFKAASYEIGHLDLTGLPFNRITSFDYDDGGIPFKLHRMAKDESSEGVWEIVELAANGNYEPHLHQHAAGRFHMLKGKGVISIRDKHWWYNENSSYVVPKRVPHRFTTQSRTVFLSIQSNPIMGADGVADFHKVKSKRPLPAWVAKLCARNRRLNKLSCSGLRPIVRLAFSGRRR